MADLHLSNFADLIGIPFVDGSRDKKVGLDCLGLSQIAMSRCGITLPDFSYSCSQALLIDQEIENERISGRWEKTEILEQGCIVIMALDPDYPDLIQHLGVYIGEGWILHTLSGRNSSLTKTTDRFFGKKIRGYYR